MSMLHLVIAAFAAVLAGFINAIAGGGTLITFPILVALGLPAVIANVTNTVALSPGYLSGTLAQRRDLKGQGKKLRVLIPLSLAGGILGGWLLISTEEKSFRLIIPYLILLASVLLALQSQVKNWIMKKKMMNKEENVLRSPLIILLLLATIYGGYFGAGVSVIVLASLGLVYSDSITRLNALKQAISFSINISAAVYFCFTGKVSWSIAFVMAAGAIIGGSLGGMLSSRIKPGILRWTVVAIGLGVALYYFVY
jgi:uncharacterized membrane protein YfcA